MCIRDRFVTAAHKLGVDPADCIVFEDSIAGGIAGTAAGARVIAVGDLDWPDEPIARIQDFTEITNVVASPEGVAFEL